MAVSRNALGVIYFKVRYRDIDGTLKQKKIENKAWKTLKEAKEAERRFLDGLNEHDYKIAYMSLYGLYIEDRKTKFKNRSLMTCQDVHNTHILPTFGKMLVSSISKDHIKRWQKALLAKGYSNDYLKKIQTTFRGVLIWGVNYDKIEKNPFTIEYVKSKEPKREMLFFTLDEFNRFIDVIEDPEDYLLYSMLYWCGLRKGELQALTIDDIDLDTKTISVTKNFDTRSHEITTPKTVTSYREIIVPDRLYELIKLHLSNMARRPAFSKDRFLFGYDVPIASTTMERRKNKYCALAGVKQIRIHDFRHSHVSLLINMGLSDFDIAKRLGHSRDMVNNTYGHWFKQNQLALVDKLNKIQEKWYDSGTIRKMT